MPLVSLPIANGSYPSESKVIADLQAINCYPNIPQNTALSQETLLGTPGLFEATTTGTVQQTNRGSWVKDELAYFVNGTTLWRVDRTTVFEVDSYSVVNLGTIPGTGAVDMSDNGKQLFILIPGVDGYIYDETEAIPLVKITDASFKANGNPLTVEFVDSFFLLTTDEKRVISSALNDGLTYSALDFASAERDPDGITGQVIHTNQQFVIGTTTTEVFSNQGAATGYALTRALGYAFDKGSRSPNSIINTNNSFMMIGAGDKESPAIWQFSGNGYNRISNTAIDNILQRATDEEIADAFGFYYSQKGAYFACFTFANRTFCYDEVTQRWHERSSFIFDSNDRFRVNSIVQAYGVILAGDSIDGRIGILDVDTYTEYGENIRRIMTTANFSNLTMPMRIPSIEATIESGVGNVDEPDPQIGLSYSDNGKNFSEERTVSMGKIGEYTKRQIWYKLGRAPRFRSWRITCSDPVKFVLISLTANIV